MSRGGGGREDGRGLGARAGGGLIGRAGACVFRGGRS